jgi:hypothetical protein
MKIKILHFRKKLAFFLIIISLIAYILTVLLRINSQRSLDQETAFGASGTFARALRLNNEVVYELTNHSKWAELEHWMLNHEVQNCIRTFDEQFSGGRGIDGMIDELFYCDSS